MECRNLEAGFECIANATFDGKQDPLVYGLTISQNSSKEFKVEEIELTYRTRYDCFAPKYKFFLNIFYSSWGTLLFAKNRADYFTVFIYHNEVVIQWNLGSGVVTHRFKKDKFDGQWLTLLLHFKEQNFRGLYLYVILKYHY